MHSARLFSRIFLLFLCLWAAACAEEVAAPRKAMVVTANSYATNAAAAILAKGGSAVDASITAQLVLTLTEPQSSGIGGGLFMVRYDGEERTITTFDGREKAPLAATDKLFLKEDGTPMPWLDAALGGRPVGVPGVVAALWLAHSKHGRLDWAELVEPAIRLAREGFEVSPRLHAAIADADWLDQDPGAAKTYFLPDSAGPDAGEPVPVGHLLKNPAYAQTLELIGSKGPDGFYQGKVAQQIVDTVRGNNVNPGLMTLADLAAYKAVERPAVCLDYRDKRVCGMGPPTSGGLTSLMILGLLEPYSLGELAPDGVMAAHLFSQASRLAFADRNRYMADADFVDVPGEALLDKAYLRSRSRLINPLRDMGQAAAGTPPGLGTVEAHAPHASAPEFGTSHLVVMDGNGNGVSMTMSVERSFGARITAGGFVLNNELTDFSFQPERNGRPVANRVEPGKRPRSSMSPTIVLNRDGTLFAAVGSPGGSRIIGYTARALTAIIDWQMPMQQAVALRHVINRNSGTEVEEAASMPDLAGQLDSIKVLAAPLADMGHRVEAKPLTSGLNGLRVLPDGTPEGGADPRREGTIAVVESGQGGGPPAD
jgi:gamma-glutamyltranspeptidase/glutathione hydrolase